VFFFLLHFLIFVKTLSYVEDPSHASDSGISCDPYIKKEEMKKDRGIPRIPRNLLKALSLVESQHKKGDSSYPWTFNAQGIGYYCRSKQKAIEGIKEQQNRGIKSIDVGCMQINLHYHPKAFHGLGEALDPKHNVHYAAEFLKKLFRKYKNWRVAVGHYHSSNPVEAKPYIEKVYKIQKYLNQKEGLKISYSQTKKKKKVSLKKS